MYVQVVVSREPFNWYQALVYARLKPTLYSSIVDATKAVLFLGTPHQGADIASWVKAMGGLSKSIGLRSTTVMHQLSRWSEPLIELSTLFSEQISDLQVTTFYEKLPTYGIVVSLHLQIPGVTLTSKGCA